MEIRTACSPTCCHFPCPQPACDSISLCPHLRVCVNPTGRMLQWPTISYRSLGSPQPLLVTAAVTDRSLLFLDVINWPDPSCGSGVMAVGHWQHALLSVRAMLYRCLFLPDLRPRSPSEGGSPSVRFFPLSVTGTNITPVISHHRTGGSARALSQTGGRDDHCNALSGWDGSLSRRHTLLYCNPPSGRLGSTPYTLPLLCDLSQ